MSRYACRTVSGSDVILRSSLTVAAFSSLEACFGAPWRVAPKRRRPATSGALCRLQQGKRGSHAFTAQPCRPGRHHRTGHDRTGIRSRLRGTGERGDRALVVPRGGCRLRVAAPRRATSPRRAAPSTWSTTGTSTLVGSSTRPGPSTRAASRCRGRTVTSTRSRGPRGSAERCLPGARRSSSPTPSTGSLHDVTSGGNVKVQIVSHWSPGSSFTWDKGTCSAPEG